MKQLLLYEINSPGAVITTSPISEIIVPEKLIEEGAFRCETLYYQCLLNGDPLDKFIFRKTKNYADHRFRLIEGWFERMVVACNGHSSAKPGLSMDSVENAKDDPMQAYFSQRLIRACSPWFTELDDFCNPKLRAIQSSCIRNLALGNIFSSRKGVGIPGFLPILKNEILDKTPRTLEVYVPEDDSQSSSTSEQTCMLYPWLTSVDPLETEAFRYQGLSNFPGVLRWDGPNDFYYATSGEQDAFLGLVQTLTQLVPLEASNIRFENSGTVKWLPERLLSTQQEEKGFFVKTLMSWMGIDSVMPEDELKERFFNRRITLDITRCVYGDHYMESSVEKKEAHLNVLSSPTNKLEMWSPWVYYVLAGSMASRFYSFSKVHATIRHKETSVIKQWDVSVTLPPLGSHDWHEMAGGYMSLPEAKVEETLTESVKYITMEDQAKIEVNVHDGGMSSTESIEESYFTVTPGVDVSYALADYVVGRIPGGICSPGSESYPFETSEWGDLYCGGRFSMSVKDAVSNYLISYAGSSGTIQEEVSLNVSVLFRGTTVEPLTSGDHLRVSVSDEPKIITYPSDFARQHYLNDLIFGLAVPHVYFRDHSEYSGSGGSGGAADETAIHERFSRGIIFERMPATGDTQYQYQYQQQYLQWVKNTVEALVDAEGESSLGGQITSARLGEAKQMIGGYLDDRAAWIKSHMLDCEIEINIGLIFPEDLIEFQFDGPIPVSIFDSKDTSNFLRYVDFLHSGAPGTEGVLDKLKLHTSSETITVQGLGYGLWAFPPKTHSFPLVHAGFNISKYFGATEFSDFRFAPPGEWVQVIAKQSKPMLDTSS